MTKRIAVFCGSSLGARSSYAEAAVSLARYLAAKRIGIVYGGGNVGLMGTLADAGLEAGAEVIGVIPQSLERKEIGHAGLSDLRVVGSMHERKALMAELADAFIALPGGFGTFEEFCEVLTWTQLGLHRKPCGILNVDGYYDHLLKLFDHAAEEGFVKPPHRQMVIADHRPESLVERMLEYRMPIVEKWIGRSGT
ncbi:MAG TPA: TIGR00730 family Rossman fold protein [Bryobacteraceae bacterium]|nr:TIGR00730 family Rossman fold protein [Bryobacteraceae bacterium]